MVRPLRINGRPLPTSSTSQPRPRAPSPSSAQSGWPPPTVASPKSEFLSWRKRKYHLFNAYKFGFNSRDFDPLEWVAFGGPAGPESQSPDGLKTGTQIKMVKRLVANPSVKFNQGFYSNDIVLVELLEPFEFNSMVNGICLAEEDVKPGQLCVTAGWSTVGDGGKCKCILVGLVIRIVLFIMYLLFFISLLGLSFLQYLSHVPAPTVEAEVCNSTQHYHGLLPQGSLCSGPRNDQSQCRVWLW